MRIVPCRNIWKVVMNKNQTKGTEAKHIQFGTIEALRRVPGVNGGELGPRTFGDQP
jgi:hypothetical protein